MTTATVKKFKVLSLVSILQPLRNCCVELIQSIMFRKLLRRAYTKCNCSTRDLTRVIATPTTHTSKMSMRSSAAPQQIRWRRIELINMNSQVKQNDWHQLEFEISMHQALIGGHEKSCQKFRDPDQKKKRKSDNRHLSST